MNWQERVIAIVGGDRRAQEIARCAAATGAEVRAYGFPWPDEGIDGVRRASSAGEALRGADYGLFPIPGIAPDGALFAPAAPERIILGRGDLAGMRAPAHIILGWADDRLRGLAEDLSIGIHEYEWDVALMLRRGPAIVEGVLKVLIENTDFTLHDSRILMVGHGTIGALVCRTLVGLGAHVDVAARNPVQRAAAHAAGARDHELARLPELAAEADIVVSSVPATVVGRPVLERVRPSTLLVDLAAPPGGFDRDAVAALGLRHVWARGLGSRAPITVGRSQWGGIRERIEAIEESRA